MNKKSILYVFLMVLFGIFTYLLLIDAFKIKTKEYVNYQEVGNVTYKVNFTEENKEYEPGISYVSSMVEDIDFKIDYEDIFSEYIYGYYRYGVKAKLVAYKDTEDIEVFTKDYDIISEKTNVLNQSNVNYIKIDDNFKIDYLKYRNEIIDFNKKYDMDLNGYLLVSVNVDSAIDFKSIGNEKEHSSSINIKIPLTKDTFKINVDEINDIGSYEGFTRNKILSYGLILVGLLCLSVTITLFIMIIYEMKMISSRENKYIKELKKILSLHDDKIINVKRFYNKKKYNLIYVDSFSELLDVYEKVKVPISYREIKRNYEAVFLIVDNDNAWIYKMSSLNFE